MPDARHPIDQIMFPEATALPADQARPRASPLFQLRFGLPDNVRISASRIG
ncbi:MAG: hypothetical protein JWN06_432 [Propionibacteriaceae bacterium]|jgi:hypothetical protein|nr:hypothetical protein [Propionibacteriaceae bacterium]